MAAETQIKREKGTQDTVESFLNFSAFCSEETEQILAQDAIDEDEFIEPVFNGDSSVQEGPKIISTESAAPNDTDKNEESSIKEFMEANCSSLLDINNDKLCV